MEAEAPAGRRTPAPAWGAGAASRDGGVAARRVMTPIDLTLDDDDDDEPILVRASTVQRPPPTSHPSPPAVPSKRAVDDDDADWHMYTPEASASSTPWVCLGVLRPAVLCMYGLPPELQLDAGGVAPAVHPVWSTLGFWGEPGFRPVSVQATTGSPSTPLPSFLTAPSRHELTVATLQPPEAHGAQPLPLNEFGKVTEKYSRVLAPLLHEHRIQCVSRARLVSRLRARVFSQEIETLLFTKQAYRHDVAAALARGGLELEVPSSYRASDYPEAPPLSIADTKTRLRSLAPSAPRAPTRYVAPTTSHERVEEEDVRRQIHAVYASLAHSSTLAQTEPGPLIVTPLFPHQKQALTFLLERERARRWDELLQPDAPQHLSLWTVAERDGARITKYRHLVTGMVRRTRPHLCRGAILADDMGLGKTLTTISLIATTRDEADAFCTTKPHADSSSDEDDEPMLVGDSRNKRTAEQARREELRCRSRATLLVCPLTVMANWESQLREHWTHERPPRVYVYHGAGRTTDPRALANYDVVLTTYSTLGNEFANQSTWTAAAGRADADPAPEAKRARIEAPNTCQRVEWFRIVLDEAHIVKEARTWQSKAVCNLSAPRRLCLTGTPIQNRIDELYALLLFLQLDPFHERAIWGRYCSDRRVVSLSNAGTASAAAPVDPDTLTRVQTVMQFLTLRRMKSDTNSDGSPLLTLPPKMTRVMTLELSVPERARYERLHSNFKEEFQGYVAQGTVGLHYATILHEILILRMMCDDEGLVNDSLDGKHMQLALQDISASIREDGLTPRRAAELLALLSESAIVSCTSCGLELVPDDDETPRSPVLTRCEHMFCLSCFQSHVHGAQAWPRSSRASGACPCCLTELRLALDAVIVHAADMPADNAPRAVRAPRERDGTFCPEDPSSWPSAWSTKTRALMADLLPFSLCNPYSELYRPQAPRLDHVISSDASKAGVVEVQAVAEGAAPPAPIKSVVFSQWTKMLDKVGGALSHAGIEYRQLDGSMSRVDRDVAMSDFRDNPHVEVFLVSLRAGGFGLNLVAGCRAYLLDPYWNPAVEQQGLDRIYRVGQTRPVVMTKLIVHRSIEEKLLALQKRKLEIANRVGRRSDAERQAERTEDLQLLFS